MIGFKVNPSLSPSSSSIEDPALAQKPSCLPCKRRVVLGIGEHVSFSISIDSKVVSHHGLHPPIKLVAWVVSVMVLDGART